MSEFLTNFYRVAGGVKSFVTNEEVQILDALCASSRIRVTDSCRLLNGDRRWYYELWLLVASKT